MDSDTDTLKDLLKDTLMDADTDTLKDLPNGTIMDSDTDTPEDLFRDTLMNYDTDTPKDLLKDTLKDSDTDTSKYLLKDTLMDSDTDTPKDLFKDTLMNSDTDTLKDVLKDTLKDSDTDTPKDLFKDTLKDSDTDTPTDLFKDTLKDSDTDTLKDVLKDTLKDSDTDTPKDLFKDTLKDSDTDTPKDLFKDTLKNTRSQVQREQQKNCELKHCTELDGNIAIHCEEDDKLLKTTRPQLQQHRNTTARQENPMHVSRRLSCLGTLANFILIAPLVVIYWNTTWTLFDHILLSHSCRKSAWASAAIGFPIMTAATFLQDSLLSYSSKCNGLLAFVISRAYTYIVSVAVVSQWRSIWMIAHCYLGRTLLTSALSFLAASLVLILLRCLVSVSAPPVSISMDVLSADYYKVPTFWGRERSVVTTGSASLLDTIITVFVVQVGVSTYWRSLWAILDFSLLPKSELLSAVCSVGIGVGLGCVLLLLQEPIRKLYEHVTTRHWLLMLTCKDLITLLYSFVCVTIWRGVWMFVNLLLPFRPNSLFIAHGVSFIVLAVCMASNSLLVRNIDRDDGRGLFFHASYMSTLIRTISPKTGSSTGVNDNGIDVTLDSGHTEKDN